MERRMEKGVLVRLRLPENPILDGKLATISETTEWGAHVVFDVDADGNVAIDGSAAGKFRALHSEMVPHVQVNGSTKARAQAKDQGYTGDACDGCGSFCMKRNGACLLCEACGASSGCS